MGSVFAAGYNAVPVSKKQSGPASTVPSAALALPKLSVLNCTPGSGAVVTVNVTKSPTDGFSGSVVNWNDGPLPALRANDNT